MRKVVLAPDSFKGTLTALEICEILGEAFSRLSPGTRVVPVPVADGGEGTVDAWLSVLGGRRVTVTVKDPLFRDIRATYGILPDGTTAVVEMAAASGLPLVEGTRDPMRTTTYGTGQLVRDAMDRGCRRILLGLGGSATNDGGAGFAAALGVRLLDGRGAPVEPTGGGLAALARVDRSDLDPRLAECTFQVACDVDSPLCGPTGASAVFGPQKGATPAMVETLDRNLVRYADLLRRDCGVDVRGIPGTGAAGGFAASLLAFARCTLTPGIDLLLDAVGFDALIADADLVITGEGRLDGQSLRGKVPIGVASRAKKAGVPVVAIVGGIGEGVEAVYDAGIAAVFSTCRRPASFEEIRSTCRKDLRDTAENLLRFARLFGEPAP